MCRNRDWLTTLDTNVTGYVFIGDDYPHERKGVGTIRLKHHDGVVRELTNVWYIPMLGNNLISLGVLEASGCKIVMDDGIVKVSRGALVLMKGTRFRNLYKLQGETIIGDVAAVK